MAQIDKDLWSNVKTHGVTHTPTLTNFQIKIIVYRGTGTSNGNTVYLDPSLCRTDFGDVRFTNSADTLLDYWIESISGTSYAIFWVKVDEINATSSIRLYYGNASATSISDGNATFVFFDDFTTLDTTNTWDVVTRPSSTITSNGTQLDIYCTGASTGGSITSKATIDTSKNYVVESQVKRTLDASAGEPGAHIGVTNKASYDGSYYGFYTPWIAIQPAYRYTNIGVILRAAYNAAVVNGSSSYANPINKTVRCSAAIDFTNRTCKGTYAYSGNTYTLTTAQGATPTGSLYWQMGSGNYNVTNHTYFDFIAVRIYDSVEPVQGDWINHTVLFQSIYALDQHSIHFQSLYTVDQHIIDFQSKYTLITSIDFESVYSLDQHTINFDSIYKILANISFETDTRGDQGASVVFRTRISSVTGINTVFEVQ